VEEFMDIRGVSSDAFFHNFPVHCYLSLFGSLKKHLPDKQLAVDTDIKQAVSSCYKHLKSICSMQGHKPRCHDETNVALAVVTTWRCNSHLCAMHMLKVEQISWHWKCFYHIFLNSLYTENINEAVVFEEQNGCGHLHLLHLQ
jgi:hypothetical protein